MTSLPLHPLLVHIPLALAFLLPVVTAGFTWAAWKMRTRPIAWLTVVALLAILLGAGLVALNTGQNEEKRVEAVVPEAAIAAHEELAEQFLWITGITLVAAASVMLIRRPAALRTLTVVTLVGTFLIAGAAIRVGHAGGRLVYVYNAGAAYAMTQNPATNSSSDKGSVPPGPGRDRDGDDR